MNQILTIFSFLIPLAIYLKSLAPAITYGDNPELISAAYSLGIPHAPGYPFFCLLGKIFSLLPLGTVAFRINLMSAVAGAATVVVLYLILKEIFDDPVCAFAASLCLAFSRVFWLYSVQAEVFALNNLLLALIVYFTLKKNWRAIFLTLGFGLANQQNIILVIPGIIYFFWQDLKNIRRPGRVIFSAFFLLLLGLLLYLYLPVRAAANPTMIGGNPVTPQNFLKVVTRSSYSKGALPHLLRNFFVSIPLWPVYSVFYLYQLSRDFSLLIFLLILLGFYQQWKIKHPLFFFFFLGWFFLGPAMLFMNYSYLNKFYWGISERLVLGSTLFAAFWLGFGIQTLKKWLPVKFQFIILLLPFLSLTANFKKCDLSHYYYGYDLGQNIFRSLAPGAILFSYTDDPFFQLQYFQIVENLRPDVALFLRCFNEIFQHHYQKNIAEIDFSNSTANEKNFSFPKKLPPGAEPWLNIILNNYQKRPVYSTDPLEFFAANSIPAGLVVQIADNKKIQELKNNPLQFEKYRKMTETIWKNYHQRGNYNPEQVAAHTRNLILVYKLAEKFKNLDFKTWPPFKKLGTATN